MRFSSSLLAVTATTMVLSSVQAFQPMVSFSKTSSLRMSSPPEQSEEEKTVELLATPRAEISTPPAPEPPAMEPAINMPGLTTETVAISTARTMDEGIYGFNKKLIDTVYDVICFLYPVKGNDRDFARFYVLETVARVPYFAYLSTMHLRETFGERYDSMSERCVFL